MNVKSDNIFSEEKQNGVHIFIYLFINFFIHFCMLMAIFIN